MMNDHVIEIQDLPGDLAEIAEAIGLEPTLKLVAFRGGETLYVPKPESVVRIARDRSIREEFTGANYSELAQKHRLTVSHVRSIVRQSDAEPPCRQMELFG